MLDQRENLGPLVSAELMVSQVCQVELESKDHRVLQEETELMVIVDCPVAKEQQGQLVSVSVIYHYTLISSEFMLHL